jgi:hypothetical protein
VIAQGEEVASFLPLFWARERECPMVLCPHCLRLLTPGRYAAHAAVCLRNLDVSDRIKSGLREVSSFGVLLARRKYDGEVAGRDGMPSSRYLRVHVGLWSDVAQWAELRPHGEWAEALWREARGRMVDLSYYLYDGSYGPSALDWDDCRGGEFPSAGKLLQRFTSWAAVLAWGGGMAEASPEYYHLARRRRHHRRERIVLDERGVEHEQQLLERLYLLEEERRPLLAASEYREGYLYDWRSRRWRKCAVAPLR